MLMKLIRMLIGKLSDEDKQKIKEFIEGTAKAAAAGAVQGAMRK